MLLQHAYHVRFLCVKPPDMTGIICFKKDWQKHTAVTLEISTIVTFLFVFLTFIATVTKIIKSLTVMEADFCQQNQA